LKNDKDSQYHNYIAYDGGNGLTDTDIEIVSGENPVYKQLFQFCAEINQNDQRKDDNE